MAIYHCSVKVISRSKGRSATAAAAYRAGERIDDQRTGLVHDYTRKQAVDHREIVAPANAPGWVHDRAELWNRVETFERRKDAQVAREVEIALPRELSTEQQRELALRFAHDQFVTQGMVADVCLHHQHLDNPHAHILLTLRELDGDGFASRKNREWNRTELLEGWREQWERYANAALEHAGHDERIDHRSFEDQGLTQAPTIKMGSAAWALEQRGITTARGDINRAIVAANDAYQSTLVELDNYRAPSPQPAKHAAFVPDFDLESPRFREARGFSDSELLDLLNHAQAQRPREIERLVAHDLDVIDARHTVGQRQTEHDKTNLDYHRTKARLSECERAHDDWRRKHPIRAKLHDRGWKHKPLVRQEEAVATARTALNQAAQQARDAQQALKASQTAYKYAKQDAAPRADQKYQQQPERAYERHLRALYTNRPSVQDARGREMAEKQAREAEPQPARTPFPDSAPARTDRALAEKCARNVYKYGHPERLQHLDNAGLTPETYRLYQTMGDHWKTGTAAAQRERDRLIDYFERHPERIDTFTRDARTARQAYERAEAEKKERDAAAQREQARHDPAAVSPGKAPRMR